MDIITNTGTEVKISVQLSCGGTTMDEMEFKIDFFTSPSKVVTIDKGDMIRESDSSYLAVVDTTGMASGVIKMKVHAEVPDGDCQDGRRTEVCSSSTEIMIMR